MNVLQRALNAIRQAVMPTAWAPTAPPGQPGGSPAPRVTTPAPAPRPAPTPAPAPAQTALQRAIAPVQNLWRDVGQGLATPGGALGRGGIIDPFPIIEAPRRAAEAVQTFGTDWQRGQDVPGGILGQGGVVDTITPTLVGRAQAEEFGIPSPTRIVDAPPSQPDTITPERRNITPLPPAPTLPGDFQTRTAVLPQAPTLAPGTFQGQAPAPAGPATRAPIMTPGTAPTPAMTPPAPFMMGGGGDREAIIGGGINIPTEAPLPPARVLPGDLGGQAPLGQFDAMIRSLQARQGLPSRFVQMPMEGASPFGFAGAQERAIRRLRDRELQRAF